jgi:hypothetical protein
MRHEREGRYTLNAGRWGPGTYRYQAEATLSGETLARDEGGFTVTPAQLELQQIMRNDRLLSSLSNATGGSYWTFNSDSLDTFWDYIFKSGTPEPKIQTQTNPLSLRTHWIWFALVVLLLGSEWFLRKKAGLT